MVEKKIYFTYGAESKDGFITQLPMTTSILEKETVTEIYGQEVLEKVPDLVAFIEECYRLLKPGGTATFSSCYFNTARAWISPRVVRGIGEFSLNFADKQWREANKFSELQVIADFEVKGNFAIEETFMTRSDDARQWFVRYYGNVVQTVLFVLTKR